MHPTVTARHLMLAWSGSLILAMSIAIWSTSLLAWFGCVALALMGALMLMVNAHTPAPTVAEIIWQTENRPRPITRKQGWW
jgi:hypothetical protein